MCVPITSVFVCVQVKQQLLFKWRPKWFICSCFHTCPPRSLFLCSLQSSELDDILNDLQNAQPQLFCEPRPVSLPSPMDKQNIINDILQMSETNPAMAAQQHHRGIGPGMGPTSESTTCRGKKALYKTFNVCS